MVSLGEWKLQSIGPAKMNIFHNSFSDLEHVLHASPAEQGLTYGARTFRGGTTKPRPLRKRNTNLMAHKSYGMNSGRNCIPSTRWPPWCRRNRIFEHSHLLRRSQHAFERPKLNGLWQCFFHGFWMTVLIEEG